MPQVVNRDTWRPWQISVPVARSPKQYASAPNARAKKSCKTKCHQKTPEQTCEACL